MAAWPLTRKPQGLLPPPEEDDVTQLREQLSSLQLALESRERAIDDLRSQAETILWSFGSDVSLFPKKLPCIAYLKDAEGRYIFANQLWERAHERTTADWYKKTDAEIFGSDVAERYRLNDLKVSRTGVSAQTIETLSRGREITYWLVTTFPVETVSGVPGLIGGVALDITERQLAEQSLIVSLKRQANHDALTALPNRILFEDRLEAALEAAGGSSSCAGLLWIDLDHRSAHRCPFGHPRTR